MIMIRAEKRLKTHFYSYFLIQKYYFHIVLNAKILKLCFLIWERIWEKGPCYHVTQNKGMEISLY